MGRLAKNIKIRSSSYAIRMPLGSSTVGPQRPRDGQTRFNVTSNNLELYYSSAWHAISTTGRVSIVKDVFTGNGVDTKFTMLHAPAGPESYQLGQDADVLVFVGGVFQEPAVAYTINGDIIEFTGTPNLGMPVVVLHNFNSTHVR